jgi:integrase
MLLLLAWRDGQHPTRRRRPGEGSVRRIVDAHRGRIVFRTRYKDHDGPSWSVRLDLEPTARARAEAAARTRAEAALLDLRRRVDQGESPSPRAERRTVGQAVAAFLAEAEASRTPTTLRTYRHWCRRIAESPLSRVALRDVRRADVASWLGRLRSAGETTGDRTGAFARLCQVFRRELAENAELHNLRAVLDAARTLRPGHQPAETRPFSAEEARLLIAAGRAAPVLDGVPIGPIVAVCLYAKTRIAEACGLRWRDVDAFGERISLVQQIGHLSGEPEDVKGKRAVTLPVDRDLIALLVDWRRLEQGRGRRCLPDELVFTDAKMGGRAVTYGRLRPSLLTLTERAGLEPSGASHRLRHASAMLSLDAGTPTPVLQRQMRHANLATTAGYLHADEPLSRRDARAVGERLRFGAAEPHVGDTREDA